jgi:hypothetical protein
MFRSGRDPITDRDWAKAQEKFSRRRLIQATRMSMLLYWMAYALNKQTKTAECTTSCWRSTHKALAEDARPVGINNGGRGARNIAPVPARRLIDDTMVYTLLRQVSIALAPASRWSGSVGRR